MATTRLMPLHTGKGRTVGQAISDIIDYTENPQKTDGGRLITSWQCDSRIADAEFLFTKNQYIQKTGRVRGEDDVIAYHLRQSFVPGEITPEEANRLGCELAKRFTKGNHAYIVCTHIDKSHIHNHVIWNSTALNQTRKFRNFWGSSRAVRRLNDTICIENGYSIVENPKRHGKSYNKWLGDKKKPSHRERICAAIDDALTQKPDSFETLLELLRQAGYEVKGKKVPSLLGGEQKKSIRMDTLGDGYTPADLRAVIAGEKAHTPRKNAAAPVKPEKRSGNLLVDRQEQLWLFDFGYMYPFDPLREFNSNGLADPLFHFVERFETRFFFSWLMTRIPDAEQQLAQYREMKRLAVESYPRKLVWLRARRADPLVLAHFQQLTARWESALADPAALSRLFAVEAFRSHVLDIEDDLHGQSCTLLTLQRIDWVINQLEQHYRFIADEGGLFYDNEGKSQQALLNSYAQKRQQAQQYLLKATAAKD